MKARFGGQDVHPNPIYEAIEILLNEKAVQQNGDDPERFGFRK